MSQDIITRRPAVQQASDSSESELEQRIKNRFFDSGHLALRSIQVSVGGETVVLSGEVETYFLKQLADSIASAAAAQARVENTITVT